jgi:protein-S-isoprenylcysteine O-methyltransferase Ste14
MSDAPSHPLELKVPPPVVALLTGTLMWGIARYTPVIAEARSIRRGLIAVLAVAGCSLILSTALSFRRARTTVHPENPEKTTTLVTAGFYRLSRNPMYLGLVLMLMAWFIKLAAPFALLGPVLFVGYIGRFQIAPEERILRAKFGADYEQYAAKVRRW